MEKRDNRPIIIAILLLIMVISGLVVSNNLKSSGTLDQTKQQTDQQKQQSDSTSTPPNESDKSDKSNIQTLENGVYKRIKLRDNNGIKYELTIQVDESQTESTESTEPNQLYRRTELLDSQGRILETMIEKDIQIVYLDDTDLYNNKNTKIREDFQEELSEAQLVLELEGKNPRELFIPYNQLLAESEGRDYIEIPLQTSEVKYYE